MKRQRRAGILMAALFALAAVSAASAQVPIITQISPQPTPAGTPTSDLVILGSGFGLATDTVSFPGVATPVSPTSWATGYLIVPVPETWSGDISVFSGAPSPGYPMEVSYSWSGEKWFNLPMTWYLNQNGAPGVALNDVATATLRGYEVWECASGFDQTYGGTTTRDGADHGDGWNVLYWTTTPWADPNLIAVATWSYIPSTGEIVEIDIHYNGADHAWSDDGAAGTMDIQHITAHEAGHTIGLLDLYGTVDGQKTMSGTTANGETYARDLTVHDVEGAEFMYPHAGRTNYTWGTPGGWWGPIVARSTADATGSWAPLDASLPGNAEVYVNYADQVTGQDCAAPHAWTDLYLDDVYRTRRGWEGLVPTGDVGSWTNIPLTVRSGRHTLRVEYDSADELVESVETDNSYRVQFAWSPWGLADQDTVRRPAPPVAGTLTYPNCEGFQFTGNWWGAVGVVPLDASDDYDLRLHDDYGGSTTGYQTVEAVSAQSAGQVDWVAVNGNVVGQGPTRWVGVTRYDAPVAGNYAICQSNQVGGTLVPGTTAGVGDTTAVVTVGPDQLLKVHEVYLPDPNVTYLIHLSNASTDTDLDFAVLDPLLDYHTPSSAIGQGASQLAGGDEWLEFRPTDAGYHGVAVFKFAAADRVRSADYRLSVTVLPPNLDATDVPSGFDAAVVPRNATGAGAGNVHVTATLDGQSPTTWVSYAVEQEGPNSSAEWLTEVLLDDETVVDAAWSGEPVPPTSVQWFDRGPFTVRGGRHTLAVFADRADDLGEWDRTDNVSSAQWVWSPEQVAAGTLLLRDPPPVQGLGTWPNCDGLAFPRTPDLAFVVGMAGIASDDDYDLGLYDDYLGSTGGYDSAHARSDLIGGAVDFVVGHPDVPQSNVYPGVTRASAATGDPYALDIRDAQAHEGGNEAEFPFVHLAPYRLVDVYQADLAHGERILFELERVVGRSELYFEIFPASGAGYYGRGDGLATSTTVVEGKEWLVFDAPQTGRYPLVVYRRDAAHHDQDAEYNLSWGPTGISGVGDEPADPTVVMLRAPAPNPTGGTTRLAFDLPEPTRVRVDIYDVRGRHVRRVADDHYPAGRHAVRWLGRDGRGQRVAAGVYYARLQAGGRTLARRLTLMR